MSPKRAKRILTALGWRTADLLREMNRLTKTSYRSGDAWKWFNGTRKVPHGVAVFLRLSVRITILERNLKLHRPIASFYKVTRGLRPSNRK